MENSSPEPQAELEELRETLRLSSEQNAELSAELRAARLRAEELEAQVRRHETERRADDVDGLKERNRSLSIRLARIQGAPPIRIYNRLRGIPPVSWIVARRVRGYKAELARAREE